MGTLFLVEMAQPMLRHLARCSLLALMVVAVHSTAPTKVPVEATTTIPHLYDDRWTEDLLRRAAPYGDARRSHPFERRSQPDPLADEISVDANGNPVPNSVLAADKSAYQPMRVVAHEIDMDPTLTLNETLYVRSVVDQAISMLQDLLMVYPMSGNLGLSHFCPSSFSTVSPNMCAMEPAPADVTCGSLITVPNEHLSGQDHYGRTQYCKNAYSNGEFANCHDYLDSNASTGEGWSAGGGVPNADFLLYVTAQQATSCGFNGAGTIAFASSCRRDQYDRPTVGYVNFCPSMMVAHDPDNIPANEDYLSTAVHEIVHALGFSRSKFAYFRSHEHGGEPRTLRDADGEPANGQVDMYGEANCGGVGVYCMDLPSNTTMIRVHERDQPNVWKIVTPKVLETVREQFACQDLNGAELENQGGSGTAGSHWEKRIFNNDFMSGLSAGLQPLYTPITLALLEDSGWYYVNWQSTLIDTPSWLYHAGCAAVTEKCLTPGVNPTVVAGGEGYFCTHASSTTPLGGCTHDRRSKASCNFKDHNGPNATILPIEHQYWINNSTFGGGVEHYDYCPYMRAYGNGKCQNPTNDANRHDRLDIYSPESMCIDSTVGGYTRDGACYQISCDHYNNVFNVTIDSPENTYLENTYTCDHPEKEIDVMANGSPGKIFCPNFEEVCGSADGYADGSAGGSAGGMTNGTSAGYAGDMTNGTADASAAGSADCGSWQRHGIAHLGQKFCVDSFGTRLTEYCDTQTKCETPNPAGCGGSWQCGDAAIIDFAVCQPLLDSYMNEGCCGAIGGQNGAQDGSTVQANGGSTLCSQTVDSWNQEMCCQATKTTKVYWTVSPEEWSLFYGNTLSPSNNN